METTVETPVVVEKKVKKNKKIVEIEPVKEDVLVKVKKTRKKKDPNAPTKERKPNSWLIHVKEYRAKHPDVAYKQVLKDAKATYKKGGVAL
jgi:type II secretory pathway component PulC